VHQGGCPEHQNADSWKNFCAGENESPEGLNGGREVAELELIVRLMGRTQSQRARKKQAGDYRPGT